MMIPTRYGPLLFSLILSGQMSLLVSGIATFRATGLTSDFLHSWISAWAAAWLFAFPAVILVSPMTRRVVRFFIAKDSPGSGAQT
ncbi:MAG TPA: DUF2798 domain-containing protein [Methyloversatilis sp.]